MSPPGSPSEPVLPPPTWRRRLRKYAMILRITLAERMVYRADFMLSTFLRFLPVVTTVLLWQAIYANATDGNINGFHLQEMVAYLLLVHISRMFSSMPGLAHGIARDIRDGNLKKYLLQPIDLLPYLVTYRMAHKCAYIATTALPYALLFLLYSEYMPAWPDAATLAAYVLALLLAFAIGFYFEAAVGMLGFWVLEVTSILYVIGTVTYFVSGQMFPLDLLEPFWATLLKVLPFQYLAYFPAMVFLGKIEGEALLLGLLIEAAWALTFGVLAHVLYRVGLRYYSAYGG